MIFIPWNLSKPFGPKLLNNSAAASADLPCKAKYLAFSKFKSCPVNNSASSSAVIDDSKFNKFLDTFAVSSSVNPKFWAWTTALDICSTSPLYWAYNWPLTFNVASNTFLLFKTPLFCLVIDSTIWAWDLPVFKEYSVTTAASAPWRPNLSTNSIWPVSIFSVNIALVPYRSFISLVACNKDFWLTNILFDDTATSENLLFSKKAESLVIANVFAISKVRALKLTAISFKNLNNLIICPNINTGSNNDAPITLKVSFIATPATLKALPLLAAFLIFWFTSSKR